MKLSSIIFASLFIAAMPAIASAGVQYRIGSSPTWIVPTGPLLNPAGPPVCTTPTGSECGQGGCGPTVCTQPSVQMGVSYQMLAPDITDYRIINNSCSLIGYNQPEQLTDPLTAYYTNRVESLTGAPPFGYEKGFFLETQPGFYSKGFSCLVSAPPSKPLPPNAFFLPATLTPGASIPPLPGTVINPWPAQGPVAGALYFGMTYYNHPSYPQNTSKFSPSGFGIGSCGPWNPSDVYLGSTFFWPAGGSLYTKDLWGGNMLLTREMAFQNYDGQHSQVALSALPLSPFERQAIQETAASYCNQFPTATCCQAYSSDVTLDISGGTGPINAFNMVQIIATQTSNTTASPMANPGPFYNRDLYMFISPNPAPTASLVANPNPVVSGNSALLTYACTNSTSASISGIGAVSLGSGGGGSVSVSPTTNTTYTLTCTGAGGSATDDEMLAVSPPPLDFVCGPNTNSATVGDTITWEVNGIVGGNGPGTYTFQWSGTDGFSSTENPAKMIYTTPSPPQKSAQVTVTSGSQSVSRTCSGSVNVLAAPLADLRSGDAEVITPGPLIANKPITFQSSIITDGKSAMNNVPSLFQLRDASGTTDDPHGPIPANMVSLSATPNEAKTLNGTLAGGLPAGIYKVRSCVNFATLWAGGIPEADNTNNCGGSVLGGEWYTFTVYPPIGGTVTHRNVEPGYENGPIYKGDLVEWTIAPTGGLGSYGYNWTSVTNAFTTPVNTATVRGRAVAVGSGKTTNTVTAFLSSGTIPGFSTSHSFDVDAPKCTKFEASPSPSVVGAIPTFKWDCTNAHSCSSADFNTGGAIKNMSGVAGNTPTPNVPNVTYTITCAGVPFTTSQAIDQPKAYISASAERVVKGKPITLNWGGDNIDYCELSSSPVDTSISATGIVRVDAPGNSHKINKDSNSTIAKPVTNTKYTTTCTAGSGSAAASATVSTSVLVVPDFEPF